MQVEEILIIKNGHENYGISTDDINQIARVPSLMHLPLRPSGVRGLCSVGGNVVSMVDMNLLLGMPQVEIDNHSSRLLSLNDEFSSNTLLVSDVYNTVEVEKSNIEYIENGEDPVIAIYKYKDSLIQVLSLEKLFKKIKKVEIKAKEIHAGKPKEIVKKEEDSERFLIFTMGNERYALEIDFLQEIILADKEFTTIAGASNEVLGLITLREELLMVIDLRLHYGFKPKISDANRILIVSYKSKKIGLCIDSILDIKDFYKKNIEKIDTSDSDIKIAGVIHDKESLISLLDDNLIKLVLEQNEAYIDSEDKQKITKESEEFAKEVIVFRLAQKEYAFDVESVDEIIDAVASTSIAFTDESLDGIINIRGQIVTIVSLFHKLNLETAIKPDSKIIVCNIHGSKIGFVVDSVSDILSVKDTDIREEKDDKYFDSVLHLNDGKRLVLSMDINKIVAKKGIRNG